MEYYKQLHDIEQTLHNYESTLALLAPALSATVPLYIYRIQQRGGITDLDIVRVQSYTQDLMTRGEDLYFRRGKDGETGTRFDQVAEIIAVLAFSPGGITVFGLHFNAYVQRHVLEEE
ncbi:hypothetical protein [Ktedonobacter robiniae]|uniref:Uncharacterized protein n=1 Tax=Ktedonobacter robiniae TaxID=2778365 RepID=A0ABQ3V214_9CHLR|nr:hypothetical protein [Ktedonobacter robiniae]GHO59194.1 hypothetical protein KSB_76690 [Ktedonobacter robiniae]